MKKFAISATVSILALVSAQSAFAQEAGGSVLERVLSSINTTVSPEVPTGTFANIAENIAVLDSVVVYRNAAGNVISKAAYDALPEGEQTAYTSVVSNVILNKIDGSITNVINESANATANVGTQVEAVTGLTTTFGDLSTTVLGAVNTGDITLGVNQNVDEAISGTASAVSAQLSAIGSVADQSALVLNVASNATDVIGSVANTMTGVNATYGDIGTTVLGAVNTGTITNGVNAAVNGVKTTVVGQ